MLRKNRWVKLTQKMILVGGLSISLSAVAVDKPTVSDCAKLVKFAQSAAKKAKARDLVWAGDTQYQDQKQLAKTLVHALMKGFGMYPEIAVEAVARSCAANKF